MIYKKTDESEEILKQIYTCIDENDGIAKKEQLTELGIDYQRVLDFVESGELIRIKNGYYTYKMDRFSEEALVSKLFPDGVLCMESALYVYGYIPEKPKEYHIAIDKNTSKSRFKLDFPKVIPYYTEPEVLKLGVTDIRLEDSHFQIYDKERLICDCIKYENKLERRVLREALLAYIQDDEKNTETLMAYAKERKVLKRVESVLFIWLDDELPIKEVIKKEKAKRENAKVEEIKESEKCISETEDFIIFIDEKNDGNTPTLVEDIFEIMKHLETAIYMSCFDRINQQLKEKAISGLYAFKDLKKLTESEETVVTIEKLSILAEYKNREEMKKKWQQYAEKHGKMLEDWERVMERFLAFLGPVWESLCKDEVFFEEWMPELERFLS